ncbi:MAG TPA: O-antigen ligase family protein [Candidatus Saccharimonadales bacterium]|nr:O-antigen ligase family protein [Candidatus Saccharimonadales bacterium]
MAKRVAFLFLIILILFPLGEVARVQLGNGVAIRANDIGIGIIFLAWLISVIWTRKFKSIFQKPFAKPIFIFVAVCAISLLLQIQTLKTAELFISASYLVRFIVYISLYFVITDFDLTFKKKVLFILGVSGFLFTALGYIQYFFYPNLRNLYYLGWDDHLYRLFSTVLDPNFAGMLLVLYFLFNLNFLIEYIANRKKTILFGFLSILSLIAVYLTYSRSALIMLLVSSVTLLVLKGKKKWLLALLGFTLLYVLVISKNFYIENINLFRVVSSEARIESSKNALFIFQKNPILGVGFNTYRYAQLRYGFRTEKGSITSHADAGTDNSLLFVLATTGIIGGIAFVYLWYRVLRLQFENLYPKNKKDKMFAGLTIASLGGIFVDCLFNNSLFYPFALEWIVILISF